MSQPECRIQCAEWALDSGFWLSLDIELRPQLGVWENVSWITGYPHWVYNSSLPTIGPIYGIPQASELPLIEVLKIKQSLFELRKIWNE